MLAICAEIELVAIFYAVVRDAQPHFRELSRLHHLPFSMRLDKDALLTEADAKELLTGTEQSAIGIARYRHQRRALTLVADNLLREHISHCFQVIGRQCLQCKPPLTLCQAPMRIHRVVVPLPDGREKR